MSDDIPWKEISPALITRWGGQAPRYTSYPTALEWTDAFDPNQFESALERADEHASDPISLYVHIPFCKKRCRFCGCASDVSTATADYDAYLDVLGKEVRTTAPHLPHRRRVAGLHLGGGTPTVLDPPRLKQLFGMLSDHFDFETIAEISLEAAPAVTDLDQIDTLSELGVNRVSFGVQDFTPEVQAAVDRIQSPDHTLSLIERARAYHMGVNIDLMYGLPRQQQYTWQKTLDTVIGIGPDRLAVFGYAHVPWMRPHQKSLDETELPNGALRLALFRDAHERLTRAGYVYIGMDHFAKPNDPLAKALANRTLSRNFQGYIVEQSRILIGFGATAISDLGDAFAQNTVSTKAYEARIHTSGNATYRGHRSSADDQLRRHVITELMCNLHLDTAEVSETFKIDFWTYFAAEKPGLDRLVSDGLVAYNRDEIRVTPLGRFFVRHVGLVFDRYSKENVAKAKFSRTV